MKTDEDETGEPGTTVTSAEAAAEEHVDTEGVGNLGDILPDPLKPLYRPVEDFYAFRETHGETYVSIMEGIVALALTGGYVWWLFLFLTGGG
ncbi:hypothetical protein [Halomicrobium salinisoli]|uniref:hypothetical protein n=1 Tax=Halomicrobium salinisoli TaxID=2878391 RepID=UPI001CF0BBF7|nr:hypothetical protein [Halomicrobium salinisoli]